jgi:hypothetical protein
MPSVHIPRRELSKMLKSVLFSVIIMVTTISNSHSTGHSRRFRNKKFHLKDSVMGEYLKIEQGSMILRLVDVSEDHSSSAEKSKMADITCFTGKDF